MPDESSLQYPHLSHVYRRMAQGDRVTIAYLGGSITWGACATDPMKTSYRARVTEHLEKTFPQAHIRAVDAAIGGTPSKLGVFRMDRDVLPCDPDLTFVEFCVNDGDQEDSQETMEGIVRKLRRHNPDMAIVLVIIGAGHGDTYQAPNREKHLELARHYNLPFADVCGHVLQKLQDKDLSTDDILHDGCHPNDAGYRLYADVIAEALDRQAKAQRTAGEKAGAIAPLTANRYENARMLELSTLGDLGDWKPALPAVVGTWFDHQPSRWLDSTITPTQTPADLHLPAMAVRGVGLYYEIMIDGPALTLMAEGQTLFEADTSMPFQYARVGWTFVMRDQAQVQPLVLSVADTKVLPKVAYLLYTP